jgi:hypothetical protein
MKQETAIHCNGCGAGNIIPASKDVICCSYCGGGIQRPYQLEQDINETTKVSSVESKEMFDTIINDPLVRSVFMPQKKTWYVDLLTKFYNSLGLRGVALAAFGIFVLFHICTV